jgi:hypothetical protein
MSTPRDNAITNKLEHFQSSHCGSWIIPRRPSPSTTALLSGSVPSPSRSAQRTPSVPCPTLEAIKAASA